MDLVQLNNGKAVTTSLKVAEYFEKRHDNVLQTIRILLSQEPALTFKECDYEKENEGIVRKYPMFEFDRDCFNILVMGFTGSKALKHKIAFVQAFNQMERQLSEAIPTLQAPQDYPSALRALATQYEVNQLINKQLEHKQKVIVDLAEQVPPKKMRTVINEVVRAYAHGEGVLYNYVWNRLYKEFKAIYHIDLSTRAKHRDQSKIDIAEDIGQLENLYLLALKMFEL
jgi:Rha family phage regulatory protein